MTIFYADRDLIDGLSDKSAYSILGLLDGGLPHDEAPSEFRAALAAAQRSPDVEALVAPSGYETRHRSRRIEDNEAVHVRVVQLPLPPAPHRLDGERVLLLREDVPQALCGTLSLSTQQLIKVGGSQGTKHTTLESRALLRGRRVLFHVLDGAVLFHCGYTPTRTDLSARTVSSVGAAGS